MNSAREILQKYWKHENFREPQEEIINAVLDDKNVVTLLPTGAGKSICFQIPTLLKEGVCIVISPLIALMEDQVNNLQKKGIKAIALTSKYNTEQTIQAFDNMLYGNYKFLYLSPEKLQSEFIQEKIGQLNVNLIAIDEAHCISQWGHDFRPAYLKIDVLQKIHPKIKTIALTASATPKVMIDIIDHLKLKNASIFKKSFYRNNINIKLINTDNTLEQLKYLLSKINDPIIVYTNTRKSCINISNYLNHQGFKSTFYHGGLSFDNKTESQTNWLSQNTPIIVATNAFGMGIDKANVRAVIHMNIPNSIENYMQEIGRAGRDGISSFAYLIYNKSTIYESENYLKKGIASTLFHKEVYQKLNDNYQITLGEFFEKTYLFNLQDFCSKYELPILKTFSAINNLELENIIEINHNYKKRSSLKIIVSNKVLFEYEKRNSNLENLIKIILRNYGGTFEQLIPINESIIAKKLNAIVPSNISKFQVINLLNQLKKDKIIIYNEATNNSNIKFLVPREDTFVINNISKSIENRSITKLEKLRSIIEYVNNNKICRNIQLLNYFGEKNIKKCKTCDICIAENNQSIKVDYKLIAKDIMDLFATKQYNSSNEIINELNYNKNQILKTLELLIEKNSLRLTSQNKFEKIE
ncbi:MAG: RecQ family ATP-dependent DNA helicase [Flavobacteriaceae bacterium]|nr:RecQ family ATP-dependent DNA helicase [Flavobacteriaceae bacterium]